MPELPEVETIVRTLAPHLQGLEIRGTQFRSRLVFRGGPEEARSLRGRRIEVVRRHGKFIVIELDGGLAITIHLGMTGKLLWNAEPGPYARAVFELGGGRLVYDDIRQFGRIEIGGESPRLARLGPDALLSSETEFTQALVGRRGRIKTVLLDQRRLRGLGNSYVDEALFRAGIHPMTLVPRLSKRRLGKLYTAIQEVLSAAIDRGGSSISDYVDGEGRRGSFQERHQVYGKAGEPCPRCGAAIRRIVVAQRGTHYCPKCQKR